MSRTPVVKLHRAESEGDVADALFAANQHSSISPSPQHNVNHQQHLCDDTPVAVFLNPSLQLHFTVPRFCAFFAQQEQQQQQSLQRTIRQTCLPITTSSFVHLPDNAPIHSMSDITQILASLPPSTTAATVAEPLWKRLRRAVTQVAGFELPATPVPGTAGASTSSSSSLCWWWAKPQEGCPRHGPFGCECRAWAADAFSLAAAICECKVWDVRAVATVGSNQNQSTTATATRVRRLASQRGSRTVVLRRSAGIDDDDNDEDDQHQQQQQRERAEEQLVSRNHDMTPSSKGTTSSSSTATAAPEAEWQRLSDRAERVTESMFASVDAAVLALNNNGSDNNSINSNNNGPLQFSLSTPPLPVLYIPSLAVNVDGDNAADEALRQVILFTNSDGSCVCPLVVVVHRDVSSSNSNYISLLVSNTSSSGDVGISLLSDKPRVGSRYRLAASRKLSQQQQPPRKAVDSALQAISDGLRAAHEFTPWFFNFSSRRKQRTQTQQLPGESAAASSSYAMEGENSVSKRLQFSATAGASDIAASSPSCLSPSAALAKCAWCTLLVARMWGGKTTADVDSAVEQRCRDCNCRLCGCPETGCDKRCADCGMPVCGSCARIVYDRPARSDGRDDVLCRDCGRH